ncbi:MAG: hypothetical protein V4850_09015 [Myxococcota bacterium]
MSLILAFLFACSTEPAAPAAAPAQPAPVSAAAPVAPAADAGHADAGVKPGSHEDWCAEHAVPESQCTQCNSSLTAAFKATDDWCAEHGLPESHCKKCNPELKIERPAKIQ